MMGGRRFNKGRPACRFYIARYSDVGVFDREEDASPGCAGVSPAWVGGYENSSNRTLDDASRIDPDRRPMLSRNRDDRFTAVHALGCALPQGYCEIFLCLVH